MSDEDYMWLAIEKAREGLARGQTPFGATIVRAGQILACCHNQVWQTTDITAHAEITALREAFKGTNSIDLSGSVIYSTCEPCPMCFAACHWAKLARAIYGASIADAQHAGFNELTISNEQMKNLGHSHLQIAGGVLREECVQLFRDFQRTPGRRVY